MDADDGAMGVGEQDHFGDAEIEEGVNAKAVSAAPNLR